MSQGDLLTFGLIVVFLLFSAFFSSSESAFLSLQRTRITHLVSTGVSGAKRVAEMIDSPERLLSTVLLGNNLVNVALSAILTLFFSDLLGERYGVAVATAAATGVGTAIVLLFGEIIPKSIAVRKAESTALLYAGPLKVVETVLLPIVLVLQWVTRRINSMLGGMSSSTQSITEGEFRTLIDIGELEGTFEAVEAEMLKNVFRFGDRQVREVMTPRTEIIALKRGSTLKEFLEMYAENSHTRFPIYQDDGDNIIGIISAKDVLKAMAARGLDLDDSVTEAMRDAWFVPETKRVAELFEELKQSGNQMAFTIDEFGGLSGLVTLKRLSEEVVGPVGEEGEAPEEEYETIDEYTYQVEGSMSIEEANDELNINLPSGDFDTIAGFALDVLGHIPAEGEQFEYGKLKFEITEMKNLKIDSIKITNNPTVGETLSLDSDIGQARGDSA
jgi:putative hemolysin